MLTMCVRALDYCPPVDLTFGEYLRAIITADVDLVPDDAHRYRVAFVEAFRGRGIYPRSLRTLSVENLIWRSPSNDPTQPSPELSAILCDLRDFGHRQLYAGSREKLFRQARDMRIELHSRLEHHFRTSLDAARDRDFLGLSPQPDDPFEVHSLHFSRRVGPQGQLLLQAIVQITQEDRNRKEPPARFEGGSTVVVDLEKREIAYCIRKSITSNTRLRRQHEFSQQFALASARTTYFGTPDIDELPEPFALLHRGV